MKNIFIVALIALVFTGCKDDKKNDPATPVTEAPAAPKNDFFQVTLDVVAKKDDSFHVFYNETGGSVFTEENSVWAEFKGSESPQKLVFNLPKDIVPTELRVDFGVNGDQDDVKINEMEISYQGNVAKFTGSQFFTLFRPNETSTTFDPQNQLVKKIKKGKGTGNGSAYPLDTLKEELMKLVK